MFCHIGDLDYLCRMIVRSSTTQRLLIKLTLLLLLALGLPSKSAAMDSVPTRDRLCTVDSNDRQGHEAVLNDVQHLYRICSSRPERVVPSANPLPPHIGQGWSTSLLSTRGQCPYRLWSTPRGGSFLFATLVRLLCIRTETYALLAVSCRFKRPFFLI